MSFPESWSLFIEEMGQSLLLYAGYAVVVACVVGVLEWQGGRAHAVLPNVALGVTAIVVVTVSQYVVSWAPHLLGGELLSMAVTLVLCFAAPAAARAFALQRLGVDWTDGRWWTLLPSLVLLIPPVLFSGYVVLLGSADWSK
ncbi:MAG: hypothetical protein AAF602_27640 [Myxococcota bacterium]